MTKYLLTIAGATALTVASAANAAVTIGSTGGTNGTTTAVVTDGVSNPNKIEFDTTNAAAGSFASMFNFFSDSSNLGVFSVTTATNPASTVSLLQLFTGGTMTTFGTTPVAGGSTTGSGNTLTLTSALLPNTWYTFKYSGTLATAGDISGPANFYTHAAVPEPASWALMLLGFGAVGYAMRRRRRPALAQIA
jgi:hypothetical protein